MRRSGDEFIATSSSCPMCRKPYFSNQAGMVMKFSRLKKIPCIVWCLAANSLLVMIWYASRPTFFDSENSPHRVYRLEFHKASPLQRIAHLDFKMPYVVRLYKIEPKTLLGESEVVDLWLNGEITWYLNSSVDRNEVRVGRDVMFEKIPAECTPVSPLVSCPRP